ncbi:myeloid-associated differentiation marker-like protein 2 [Mastacembelus armatus]|uniref:myeloid-associated differentiation marker-like protein 2 n=1 Tax=Mastacembelus armatus TaxID=205130 RepID=UPI000E459ED2|nr:myeloid-associated differentiation marker-like protein 2 [Mastacembelus armatus]
MFGPFQSCQNILRLLEMIFSTLSLIIVIFRGRMVSPWGVWCEFVWFFCIIVPLVLLVVEAKKWNILLVAFLPNWDDLTCGLTILCVVMITSATVTFVAVFVCSHCIASILCFISSLIATVVFLVDAVKQKMKCPSGYMSSLRGILRTAQAFVACIIITAALDHFVIGIGNQKPRPIGMILSTIVFFVCLLVTVFIIVLNLLKLLQCLLSFGLSRMEFVFDILAVVLYLLAVILWGVFGYKRYQYNPYSCDKCSYEDLNTVTIGAIINLVLYTVDLVLAFKSC